MLTFSKASIVLGLNFSLSKKNCTVLLIKISLTKKLLIKLIKCQQFLFMYNFSFVN